MKIVIPEKAIRIMKEGRTLKRVFDWNKAAMIIKTEQPIMAQAYLLDQKETTGGIIYRDGQPVCDTYTYLQSDWDIPVIEFNGQIIDCWCKPADTPDGFSSRWDGTSVYRALGKWNAFTKWPETALKILED